jgi:polyisoprenoid-binding protein YceI
MMGKLLRAGLFLGIFFGFTEARAADGIEAPSRVAIQAAAVDFTATSNLKALTVQGRSESVRGSGIIQYVGDKVIVQTFEASVAVDSLSTGMDLRDRHMRERIFTDASGKLPDVTFKASNVTCAKSGPCDVSGSLSIRGLERPAKASLRLDEGGLGRAELAVNLSSYGIELPSHLGVKIADQVKVKIDLKGQIEKLSITSAR